MKQILIMLLAALFSLTSLAQSALPDNILSIGIGLANENNVSNYGLVLSNDLKISVSNRFYLNPRIGFFQSLGSFESAENFGYRSHSGVFLDFGLSYAISKRPDFETTLNIGPSYQLGNESYGQPSVENYKIRRLGAYGDLELSWQAEKVVHTIGVKSNFFGIYPEFLGVVYKLGVKVN